MSDVNWRLLIRRRDHTFQPPVPENTAQFGIPNACTTCHDDRTPEWAAKQMTAWWGDGERRAQAVSLADTMYRAGSGDATTLPGLAKLAVDRSQGFLVRASAADYIGRLVAESALWRTQSRRARRRRHRSTMVLRQVLRTFYGRDLRRSQNDRRTLAERPSNRPGRHPGDRQRSDWRRVRSRSRGARVRDRVARIDRRQGTIAGADRGAARRRGPRRARQGRRGAREFRHRRIARTGRRRAEEGAGRIHRQPRHVPRHGVESRRQGLARSPSAATPSSRAMP